jgi:formate hydrogenlyase transcriptional activator
MLAEATLLMDDGFRREPNDDAIIGESSALKEALRQVEVVAPTDATVLLHRKTGTGKERLAHAVHRLSARRDQPFSMVNCAAIPAGLLESELFGHERGAFTGAIAQKLGRFELAHQGTLFLDEIGDIPLELQPKLLRVLQEQAFERLGSTRTQRVDVRLVAATNRNLAALVDAGQFRADLYYRLHVFPILVPPLRQRLEDIPLLVRHFVRRYARQLRKRLDTIPAEAMMALTRYAWPGNVRQL